MLLRRHLLKYVKKALAKPVCRRPPVVLRSNRQVFCGFATAPDDKGTYEIDLISLKKTPKEREWGQRYHERYERHERRERHVGHERHERHERGERGRRFETHDPSVPEVIPKSEPNKEYLSFVGRFYPQLQLFNKFIELAKSQSLEELSQSELVDVLNEFKTVNALPPQDPDSMFMANRLSHFLAFDNNFAAKLQEVISEYQISAISNDGLALFSDELISLSKEFDFGELGTSGNLAKRLDTYLEPFDFSVNTKDHHLNHHLDATFYKLSIQAHRYKTLTSILTRNKDVKLANVVELATTQLFPQPSEVARVHLALVAPFYKLLVTLKVIDEFKDYDSFIDIAPKLYELSHESLDYTIRAAAEEVVSRFFTLYCLGHISRNASFQRYFDQFMKETYEPNAIIQLFAKDTENFCATALYDAGVLNLTLTLQLFSKYHGSFEDCSKEEFLWSLQKFKKGSKDKTDLERLENSILYLFKNMPWVEVSVLETLLNDKLWISSLSREIESFDIDTAAQLNKTLQSPPTESSYLSAFNGWLGIPISTFDKETALRLLTNFDKTCKTPLVNVEKQLLANMDFADFEVECLQVLQRDILMDSFENCTSVRIIKTLDSSIEHVFNNDPLLFTAAPINHDNVVKFVRLRKRLAKLFHLNNGYTPILDLVLKAPAKVDTPAPYVQIPDELELDSFVNELEIFRSDELKKSFAESSSAEILQLLKARTDELYYESNSNPGSRMTTKNVLQFVRLTKKLQQLFNVNGGNVAILDTLLQNQKVFESVQQKIKKPVKPYVQLPDDLELHKFHKELGIFRDDELRKNYGVSSINEIHSLLDSRINEVINNLPSSNPSSRLNKLNVDEFARLSKRLTRLFEANGGNTAVLDTLINSQSVFEQFEKKKTSKKPQEYRQIPDDFHLEEYIAELIQLRNILGLEFKIYSPLIILAKLKTIASREPNTEKQVLWNKLYRNLAVLFKINNGNTFILDSVLVNHEVFMKFESNKTISHIGKEENSSIGESGRLVNEYYEYIGKILQELKLLEKDGIWKMPESTFDHNLQEFETKLDKSAYDFPIYLNLIKQLKTYNSQIEYYPNFLQQLYEIKTNNMEKKLNMADVEEIYKAFIENVEYEANESEQKPRIVIPIDENKTNKFDLKKFINEGKETDTLNADEVMALKTDYNDSEKLISLLTKQEGPVDLENSELFRPRLADDDYAFELEVKDALSIALKTNTAKALVPEAHKKVSKAKSVPSTGSTKGIDKSSFEQFLQNAKKDSDLARKNKSRESEAYEWSKSMYNSHRSIDSRDYFNPLGAKSRRGLFFPGFVGRKKGPREYLVLTLEGQTFSWDRSSKGVVPQEDIFKILNNFDKSELKKLMRTFNKLQRKGWKLVGSNVEKEDQKYLILSRLMISRKHLIVSWIKSIFATTGVILISLVGLSLWMDTETSQKAIVPAVEESQEENSPIVPIPNSQTPSTDGVIEQKVPKSWLGRLLWE